SNGIAHESCTGNGRRVFVKGSMLIEQVNKRSAKEIEQDRGKNAEDQGPTQEFDNGSAEAYKTLRACQGGHGWERGRPQGLGDQGQGKGKEEVCVASSGEAGFVRQIGYEGCVDDKAGRGDG